MKKTRGFTLIELLVAIAILSIMVAISYGAMSTHREKVRDARRVSELSTIKDAISVYFEEHGEFPEAISDIASFFNNDTLPLDPKTPNPSYDYKRSFSPNGFCLGATLEYVPSTASCDSGNPSNTYTIQGP